MNVTVAALAMLLVATLPILATGFAQVMVPDPNGPPLEAEIRYPSDADSAACAQAVTVPRGKSKLSENVFGVLTEVGRAAGRQPRRAPE